MANFFEFPVDRWIIKMATDYAEKMKELEKSIGYRFADEGLLRRALTRRSYANENDLPENDHMDALATLGDAVLDLLVISRLIERGGYDKGAISTEKMDIVNMTRLRRHAEDLRLEEFVRWGKGEDAGHVWTSGRVLAECLESLVGALYLDAGLETAREFLTVIGLPSGGFWNECEEKGKG
jgi:ribonuclease-3